jgi:hypothetical protein
MITNSIMSMHSLPGFATFCCSLTERGKAQKKKEKKENLYAVCSKGLFIFWFPTLKIMGIILLNVGPFPLLNFCIMMNYKVIRTFCFVLILTI